MKMYIILFLAILVCLALYKIFNYEFYRSTEGSRYEKIMNVFRTVFYYLTIVVFIGFYFYNIYSSIYGIADCKVLSVLYIIMAPCFIIAYKMDSIKFKYLDIFRKIFRILLLVVGVIVCFIYVLYFIDIIVSGHTKSIENSEKIYKEYSHSIDIVEMEEVPYTNTLGGRWYVRSSPTIAYYYEVITENGNQTTKIIDGYQYYVEKDENDKYIENPHIKVYHIVREYTNLYGKEKEEFVTYEYTICVPENSIYYEE